MSSAAQQQQLLKILEDLLKLPENRDCADCGTKAPRWSSTNLGVFVCIRCSGIHRAMGTHISKVKSVSLDKWTPEQVEFMQKMGNGKAKEIYEANVDGYQKGDIRTDNIALEQWIRDKYEHKRFMRRDYDSRQQSHHNNNHHNSSHSHSSHSSHSHSNSSHSAPSQPTTRPVRQNSNPPPVSRPPATTTKPSLPPVSAPAPAIAAPQAKPVGDLLNWDDPVPAPTPAASTAPGANTSSNAFGDFGDFVSASTPAQPAAPAPVDKNSILQLYNTPIAPQAGYNPYGVHPHQMQQQHHYPAPNYNIAGLGVPGAVHPGMMGGIPPMGMPGMNPGMGMGGMPPGMNPGMGMPGMTPGMGAPGMMPGMGMPGMAPGYPMGGVPGYYGIPNQQLGMRPTGVPNQTF